MRAPHAPARPAEADESFYRELLSNNYLLIEQTVRQVARRHRLRNDDADELGSIVRLRLVEDSYAVLRKYEGRSALSTYLTKVITRILFDWRVAQWGRWRPSSLARRLGDTAVLFETLTRRDGFSFDQACEILRTNHLVPASVAELEALHRLLPVRMRRRMVSETVLDSLPAPAPLQHDETAEDRIASSVDLLPSRDREVVRMVYGENLAIVDVARTLHIDQRVLYRRLDRVRRQLRARLVEPSYG